MKTKEAASVGSVPLLITEVVFLALAVVAVLCRFLLRLCVKKSLGWDDAWIMAALVLFWVHQSLQFGRKPAPLPSMAPDPPDFRSCYITITAPRHVIVDKGRNKCLLCSKGLSVQLEYISALLCKPSALCVKASLLFLYRRLFPLPWVHWATSTKLGGCVVWAVTFWFPLVFMCTPPKSLWNAAMRRQCFEAGKSQLVAFTTDFAIDTVILSLPIRMVIALQLAPRRKFLVLMIFLLGGL